MKAKLTKWAMMLIAMMTLGFTSCSEDQEVGINLEGVWEGSFHISSTYNGRTYNVTKSTIEFVQDWNYLTKGDGYWVDYYSGSYFNNHNYVASKIRWEVENGVIHIHFWQFNDDLWIRDYRISDSYFEGVIYDGDNYVSFSLRKTYSPNWDSYSYDNYYGYDYWSKGEVGTEQPESAGELKRRIVPPMK